MNYCELESLRKLGYSESTDNPKMYHYNSDLVTVYGEQDNNEDYTYYFKQRYIEQLQYLGFSKFEVEIGQKLNSLSATTFFSRGKCDLKCCCFEEDLTDERNEEAFSDIVSFLGKVGTAVQAEIGKKIEQHLTNKSFDDIRISLGSEKTITVFFQRDGIKYSISLFVEYTSNTISVSNSVVAKEEYTKINFDAMDGHEFEYFCADILCAYGFTDVTVTQGSGDQGIDVIAYRDGIKHGVQCKCYSSTIGNKAIQEALAGKIFYQCHVGIVLTNNYFTKSAQDLAEHSGIVLWDRYKLLEMIEKVKNNAS